MSVLHYVQKLFSLDTLDTRFAASAKPSQFIALQPDPVKPSPSIDGNGRSIHANGAAAAAPPKSEEPSPSKWRTPEFYFYFLFIAVALPLMFNAGYEVSKRKFEFLRTFQVQKRWEGMYPQAFSKM